jgi:primary-amine oxidase
MPGPDAEWLKVLDEAGLSELFVPYASGSPRYYDFSNFQFDLVEAVPADAGPCGILLDSPPRVVREVRDKGILWKDDEQGRRGQVLVLWATLDAANYNYLIEYRFHDVGIVEFRTAGTAVNLPSKPLEAHMHNALWRIDIDVGGRENDRAEVFEHVEPDLVGGWTDQVVPFNGGREGWLDWDPHAFTELRVSDPSVTNAQGDPISWSLRPQQPGRQSHVESFMEHDAWVTRWANTEFFYPSIESYVANQESVVGEDVVLWATAPVLHVPRSEDGVIRGGEWDGVALAMWGGLELRPRNLFVGTPFR